jgi:hypothetical protein
MWSTKKVVKFQPIKQLYYRKLVSANQTGLLASSYTQVSSLPVFSGSRTSTFTDDFFESIGKRLGASSGGKTIEQLQVATKTILNELIDNIKGKGSKIDMGTVKWRDVSSLTDDDEGVETNLIVLTSNKYFLGRN